MPYEITNPRFFPGNISGLGMTSDDNGRSVDTRYGIHIDTTNGCLIEHPLAGQISLAYAVDGTLEDTTDRVRALYLLSPAVTAQMVSELTSMLLRADPAAATALVGRLSEAICPPPREEPEGDQEGETVPSLPVPPGAEEERVAA